MHTEGSAPDDELERVFSQERLISSTRVVVESFYLLRVAIK